MTMKVNVINILPNIDKILGQKKKFLQDFLNFEQDIHIHRILPILLDDLIKSKLHLTPCEDGTPVRVRYQHLYVVTFKYTNEEGCLALF